jgi:hypothetical protein
MTWLRVLHLLGLTNLSAHEVQRYEEMVRTRPVLRDIFKDRKWPGAYWLDYLKSSHSTRSTVVPLRNWIVLAGALTASAWVGVCASAVGYDLFMGTGLNLAQAQDRTLAWIMYPLCNYGLAILTILLLRFAARSLRIEAQQSRLITYCWTFLVAFFAGPFGLTLAVHFFGEGKLPEVPLLQLYFNMLKWGLGPALASVYISYYLDRQKFQDLPDIDHSSTTLVWRLTNCIGFAVVNVFLLLPQLLSLTAQPDANWDSPKLRFVASGSTFSVALGLALAAQFALRKGTEAASSHLLPEELGR